MSSTLTGKTGDISQIKFEKNAVREPSCNFTYFPRSKQVFDFSIYYCCVAKFGGWCILYLMMSEVSWRLMFLGGWGFLVRSWRDVIDDIYFKCNDQMLSKWFLDCILSLTWDVETCELSITISICIFTSLIENVKRVSEYYRLCWFSKSLTVWR